MEEERAEASLLERLFTDDLFRDSSVVFGATLISGGLNYAYQVSMGRMLGPEAFGVFGSLFALFYIVGVLGAGVGYCSTQYVSSLSRDESAGFLRGLGIRVMVLTVAMFLLFIALSPILASSLKISDPFLVVLMAVSIFFGLPNQVNNGALRGLQKFVAMGGLGVTGPVLKLVTGVGLVLLGFGIYGAIGAMIVSSLFVFLATTVYLRKLYISGRSFHGFKEVYVYAIPSILTAFCFTVLANGDVLIVKNLFSPEQAGLYVAISVMGKILIFLPSGVVGAMFPKVSDGHSKGGETHGLLKRGLLYTGTLTAIGVVIYTLFSEELLIMLFGASYLPGAYLLPWYGLVVFIFSLNIVLLNYTLARHETLFVKLFTALTIIELFLMFLLGETMLHVVLVLLTVNLLALVAGLAITMFFDKYQNSKNSQSLTARR